MHWFKIHHGFSSNPKLGFIAHKLQIPRAIVNAIFIDILEYASRRPDRGSGEGYDTETAAYNLGLDSVTVSNAVTLLLPLLESWEEYQSPKDRTNAVRQRRFRNKQKQGDGTPVTDRNALRNTDKSRLEKKERGSRFTLTQLPDEWKEFCLAERKDLNPENLFQGFRDYWVAVSGSKGVKLDWFATWRNWCRAQKSQQSTLQRYTEKKSNVKVLS